MARRKSSTVEDLFEITAALPWWVGAILSLVAYVVLHHYAVAEVQTVAAPGQFGQMMTDQILKTFAGFGQYILPILFTSGAIASFFGRRKRAELVRIVGSEGSGSALRGLSWRDFELLVGEAFRMNGYSVTETGGGGADGGIDLVLKKHGEVFLVQCKQWRAFKVSVNIVRELFGVMAAQGATGGFVVTSGIFTKEATAFAQGRNIELIDGAALTLMIDRVKAARLQQIHPDFSYSQPIAAKPLVNNEDPSCPKCGGVMVKRTATKGANVGGTFWGCPAFPKCRGVRNVG
ncbi:restriction endonuclease [Methylomonas sp. SURF-2]|uniref:Restriction endonuclease n=1 Tax=Methylomonas subterranea TaxID=2952225 RepID=A0ABT1TBS1_9GAMM|nr:restriction endonuclease [Methylomonas sp. SURF-2]MCQ8102855.1 restriction endonuclease [Methylomonas sp. SURF-2]